MNTIIRPIEMQGASKKTPQLTRSYVNNETIYFSIVEINSPFISFVNMLLHGMIFIQVKYSIVNKN
jgi:hypothetical protein